MFLNIHRSGVLTALAWLVSQESAARESISALCTPCNHAPCHFMQSHIRKVYACLAVTCHLHFWQNDRGLLRATVLTWGWNGYRNKSQHRKLTLEKKILPLLQQGFEPATFRSQVRCSNHRAIPAPHGGKASEDSTWLPMRWGSTKQQSNTQSAHPMECICRCATEHTGWPPVFIWGTLQRQQQQQQDPLCTGFTQALGDNTHEFSRAFLSFF